MSYYVHYTVRLPPKREPQYCVAGPYDVNEVTNQRRDISTYANVEDVFVSEEPKHAKGN